MFFFQLLTFNYHNNNKYLVYLFDNEVLKKKT